MIVGMIIVGFVAGAIGGVVAFLFMEAWWVRMSENQITETEFYEDTTTYDVPEMTDDCDMDDRPLLPDDDESRRRGGVTW